MRSRHPYFAATLAALASLLLLAAPAPAAAKSKTRS